MTLRSEAITEVERARLDTLYPGLGYPFKSVVVAHGVVPKPYHSFNSPSAAIEMLI
jgi:hypothetical protein